MYISVIQSLGVEVSSVKTHRSPHFFELAKRLFFKGTEITPFPLSGVKSVKKKYYLLYNYLHETQRKGWITKDGIPSTIEEFFTFVHPLRRKFRLRLRTKAEVLELMYSYMSQSISVKDLVEGISKRVGLGITIPFSESLASKLVNQVVMEVFKQSMPQHSVGGKPLGDFAMKVTMSLTEEETYITLLTAGLELHMIPQLQVYGQVEEKYMRARDASVLHLINRD
jgi:hypothetical protein